MRKFLIATIVTLLIAFSFGGCSKTRVVYKTPTLPKLKSCKVGSKKIKLKKRGDEVVMSLKSYKLLKKQNYRLRVCNELLNKQCEEFNRRFVK